MSGLIRRTDVLDVMRECHLDEQLFEKEVFDKIKNLPTIEAVPVVHGEWIFDKYTAKLGKPYRCSNCNEEFGDTYNFCPNCGASMKGGIQNSYRNSIIDELARKAIERLEEMSCEAWRKDIMAIAEEMKGGAE